MTFYTFARSPESKPASTDYTGVFLTDTLFFSKGRYDVQKTVKHRIASHPEIQTATDVVIPRADRAAGCRLDLFFGVDNRPGAGSR
jgi:hypothetical protein